MNALTLALASVLIAGVSLYALAIVLQALLGWPVPLAKVGGIHGLTHATWPPVTAVRGSSRPGRGRAWAGETRWVPLIGAFPKIFIPAVTVIPGLAALVLVHRLGQADGPTYNDAIPALIGDLLPSSVLGVAVTGLLAAFMAGMAGMAANVSSLNTVFTYDIWQDYVRPGRPDEYYLRVGRTVTVAGVVIGIGTAFIAPQYDNIMSNIQALFSLFNAPLFATFLIGMFWKRMTPWAGFAGLVAGTVGAAVVYLGSSTGASLLGIQPVFSFGSPLADSFYGAIVAFVSDAVVSVAVTLVTAPKPESELAGLDESAREPGTRGSPDPQPRETVHEPYSGPCDGHGVVSVGKEIARHCRTSTDIDINRLRGVAREPHCPPCRPPRGGAVPGDDRRPRP